MDFLLLFSLPILIPAFAFVVLKRKITVKEFLLHVGLQAFIAVISLVIIYHAETSDVEIRSGSIIKKAKEEVSCSHSYRCMCYQSCSGSGSNRSCTEICSTCYMHSYDIDWAYYTTENGRSTIDRLDSQGVKTPSRWVNISEGEPTASRHSYTNYIKGSSSTLFKSQGVAESYAKLLQTVNYPNKLYDYYKVDRFVTVGFSAPNANAWNSALMQLNQRLGAAKQVNVILVLVMNDQPFFDALSEHWLGGKKNDVIIVVGVQPTENKAVIKWSDVMAWSKTEDVKIALRNSFLDLKEIDLFNPDPIMPVIERNIIDSYERKPMADFEYLKKSIRPSPRALCISLVIGIIASIGLTFVWVKNDFGEFTRYSRGKRKRRGFR